MGFWSSVGSFCSGVVSAVSSGVRAVGSAVAGGFRAVQNAASNAIGWLADKGEKLVGKVVDVWNSVSPYLKNVLSPLLKRAAEFAPWPWLKVALIGASKVIDMISGGEIKNRVQKAMEWVIKMAERLKQKPLNEKEIEDAEINKIALQEAHDRTEGEHRRSVELSMFINNYMILKSKIALALENPNIDSFDSFLRLRAAQKLFVRFESDLDATNKLDDVSNDILFLVEVAVDLLNDNPQLPEYKAVKMDKIIQNMFGKGLLPFVFEELTLGWAKELDDMEVECDSANKKMSANDVQLRKIINAEKISELTDNEAQLKNELMKSANELKIDFENKTTSARAMRNFIYASEGFQQFLEMSEEDLIKKEIDHLAESVPDVAKIIIDCAQNGKKWADLNSEDQGLVIDFANIFRADSKARIKQLSIIGVTA